MEKKKTTTKKVESPKVYEMEVNHNGQKLPMKYNGKGHVNEIKKHNGKFFEIHMLDAISRLPYLNGICMDIGANVGNHTVFFSRFCNFDEVWAYEPDPDSFVILEENVKNNTKRTVRLFNVAIGAERAKLRMKKNKEEPPQNKMTNAKGPTLVVPITTNLKVALMKIDVEGFELEVIKGAFDVIDRERPELFIECHKGHEPILEALPKGYRYVRTFNNAPTHHFTSK